MSPVKPVRHKTLLRSDPQIFTQLKYTVFDIDLKENDDSHKPALMKDIATYTSEAPRFRKPPVPKFLLHWVTCASNPTLGVSFYRWQLSV